MAKGIEDPTTRGTFLRRVGITLGAAIGFAAFPSNAYATNCCVHTGQCDNEPPCSQTYYYCNCPEQNYCLCRDHGGNCVSGPC
jgi:hypothetical protein